MTHVVQKRRATVRQDCAALLCFLGHPVFPLWLRVEPLRFSLIVRHVVCLRAVQVKPEAGQEWTQPSGCLGDGKQPIVYSCQWWINDRLQHWGQGLKAWGIWAKKGGADAPSGQRADGQILGDTKKGRLGATGGVKMWQRQGETTDILAIKC